MKNLLKKTAVLGLILFVVALPIVMALSTANVQAPLTWNIETVDSTGVVGWHTSIALDSSGNPHISYQDYTYRDLKYAKWNGSAWNIETVDSPGDTGWHTSLALDPWDRPHISYFGRYRHLKYAMWNGSAWSIQTVDSTAVGAYSSIAVDSSGFPSISYRDSTNDELKIAWGVDWPVSPDSQYATGDVNASKKTGITWLWILQTVDSTENVGYWSSLAVDSGRNYHISYYDWTNGDLKYAMWNGSAWNIETVDSTGDVGRGTSLALDSGDKPHISYYDDTNGDLKLAWPKFWIGKKIGWSKTTVDSTGDVGSFCSLALDSGNNRHISYKDWTNGDLKYAWWTGYAWSREIVDSTGDVGSFCSLALDSGNRPHISYLDGTNGDLKYATVPTLPVHNIDTGMDFFTIQAAIDNVYTLDGHTIQVDPGSYNETVRVYKELNIYGAGADVTIVNAPGSTDTVFNITVNNVNMSGFTVKDALGSWGIGVMLHNSDFSRIENINASNNDYGIYLHGSWYNTIAGNNVSNNDRGICLSDSWYNTIAGNNVSNNNFGIELKGSSDFNTVTNNNVSYNGWGILVWGMYGAPSHNVIDGNEVTHNSGNGITLNVWEPPASYNNVTNNKISNNGFSGISIEGEDNTLIAGNTINSNYYGVRIWSPPESPTSWVNTVTDNAIFDNNYGIAIEDARTSFITGNTIANNNLGIYLYRGDYSWIYHNNFLNNVQQASLVLSGIHTFWNDSYPSGGNHWSDYTGVDLYNGPNQNIPGSDGIGDTPYVIDPGNQDNYPFMRPRPHVVTVTVDGQDYDLALESDAVLTEIAANESSLSFDATGPPGQTAYVNATFPVGLNNTAIKVYINDVELVPPPWPVITTNGTHYFVYFEVSLSTKAITIQYACMDTVLDFWFTPNPVPPGEPCELYGTLTDADTGMPVYPASVDVEYSADGGLTWNYIWTLNTNAAGEFSQIFTAPGVGDYLVRVSYAGSAIYNPSSDTETLVVEEVWEGDYHFQISPYSDVLHLKIDGSVIYGILDNDAVNIHDQPVLGYIEGGSFYLFIDATKDDFGDPLYYELIMIVGSTSTLSGDMYQTVDGTSWVGPTGVTLVSVPMSTSSETGESLLSLSSVTPEGWPATYNFQLSPWDDIVHLHIDGAVIHGLDDSASHPYSDQPVLGYLSGDFFIFAIDWTKDDFGDPIYYELGMIVGSVSTLSGNAHRTTDGKSWDFGPAITLVWAPP